jgi:hypothetical protein
MTYTGHSVAPISAGWNDRQDWDARLTKLLTMVLPHLLSAASFSWNCSTRSGTIHF